ncbi:MAG TPA: hypothetical protein VHQ22_08285 [Terriglobales bacterium]|jgi:hypothetical protein|nr:hypothetical protein [Terriglobales bacterium]
MKAETSSKALPLRHPDVAFERTDMSHGSVFGFLLTLACGLLLVHIALWGIFHYLGKPLVANHQTTNPIMTSNEELKDIGGDPALTFPKPTLQPNDVADLNKFRAAEEEQLTTYGWVDPGEQKIRIPIERAIDALSTSWPNQQNSNQQTGSRRSAATLAQPSAQTRKAHQGKEQ